jgi:hypothetical protein
MMRKLFLSMALLLVLATAAFASWSTPVRIAWPGGFEYPQILAQGDTIHVVFMHLVSGRGIGYIRSTDAGLTWSHEIGLVDTVNTYNNLFPKIMRYNQRLLAVWTGNLINWPEYESVHYSLSTDDGLTWSQDQRITSTDRGNIVYFSASNYDSLINVMFNSNSLISDSTATFNIMSTNFGTSWSQPREIKRCRQSDVPDQVSRSNLVHYTWAGNFSWGDTWEVYYMRSTDGGLSWSPNIPISSIDNQASQMPGIAANEIGNPVICWLDSKYSPPGILGDIYIRASTDLGTNWAPENQVTTNHKTLSSDICWADDTIRTVWEDARFGANSIKIGRAHV